MFADKYRSSRLMYWLFLALGIMEIVGEDKKTLPSCVQAIMFVKAVKESELGEASRILENLVKVLARKASRLVVQLEQGEEQGLFHFQGYLRYTHPQPKARVIADSTKFGFGFKVAYKVKEGADSYINYCLKEQDFSVPELFCNFSKTDGYMDRYGNRELYIDLTIEKEFEQMRGQLLFKVLEGIKGQALSSTRRKVNIIYDPKGGAGKSTYCRFQYMRNAENSFVVDVECRDTSGDISNKIVSVLKEKRLLRKREYSVYFDCPKTLDYRTLTGVLTCAENIKNGRLCDPRYSAKYVYFPSNTHVFVLLNECFVMVDKEVRSFTEMLAGSDYTYAVGEFINKLQLSNDRVVLVDYASKQMSFYRNLEEGMGRCLQHLQLSSLLSVAKPGANAPGEPEGIASHLCDAPLRKESKLLS